MNIGLEKARRAAYNKYRKPPAGDGRSKRSYKE